MLTNKEDALLVNKLLDIADAEKSATQIREAFWGFGEVIELPDEITLRKVSNADREGFFALQRCYSPTPAMLEQEAYKFTLYYEREDETELLIRVLSFGPVLKVVFPDDFIKKLCDRLEKQKRKRTQT